MELEIHNTTIPNEVIERWQDIVDIISDLASVPSAMINRLDPPDLEIFRSNTGADNPFPSGTRMPMLGVYCESAAKQRRRIEVTDAREDPQWCDSPTAKAGIYAYLGYPLVWPDDTIFGTLCVIDTRAKVWNKRVDRLISCFKHTAETHLALVYAMEAAKASDRAKSEFLANMSHEIRTPMTAILGFSEVLTESPLNQEQEDAVSVIQRNGEHLIGLVNNILDLSKIEARRLCVERISCSPCQILGDVAKLLEDRANEKGLKFEIKYDSPIPESIISDPTRLYQVLVNLGSNALKFTETGRVCMAVRLVDNESPRPLLRFDVIDTGIGITEEQIARIFRPFCQADPSTTRKYGGTGLGLAISKRLVEEMGGELTVESVSGRGSTFSATVETGPLSGTDFVADPYEWHSADAPTALNVDYPSLSGRRILLAEDSVDIQRLVRRLLEKAGAKVTIVEHGQAACDCALAENRLGSPFDAILMDMQMPVMDGYEATRTLRAADYGGAIIALTAHAMKGERDKCLQAGCDSYASKPIDRGILLLTIARHLDASRQEREATLSTIEE